MYIHIFYCAITKCGELWFRFKLVHDSTSREINDGNVYFSRSTDSFFFLSSTFLPFFLLFFLPPLLLFFFLPFKFLLLSSIFLPVAYPFEKLPRIYANASALCDYANRTAETFDFRINNYFASS